MTDLHISADQDFAGWLHYPAEFDSPHSIHLSQQLSPCVNLLNAGLVWDVEMLMIHLFLFGYSTTSFQIVFDCLCDAFSCLELHLASRDK